MSTPLSAQHRTQLGTPPPGLMLPMLPYYPHYGHFPPTAASNPADILSHTPATPASKPQRKYQASARKKAPPISLLTGMAGETVESLNNDQVKLETVLRNIQAIGWTIGDFLYHFSKGWDASAMLSSFLSGRCSYTPSHIIEAWVKSPMGIPKKGHPKRNDMFSLVKENLVKKMEIAVVEEGGLHTFSTGAQEMEDDNFGSETLERTITLFKDNLSLLWDYLVTLATPHIRNRRSHAKNAAVGAWAKPKNHRPPEIMIIAYALSSICFSCNQYAKLLPVDKGLLLFACSANRYLFALESRNGSSVSYHAAYESLKKYAQHDSKRVHLLGTKRDRGVNDAAIRSRGRAHLTFLPPPQR
ncbi:hypothetical protein ARMSODRAFT_1022084 [Armillaria solidipes]|uniref:Uncharacterized protein n=1 Tax=Armillaria solidipes TaxID=1076256 RepID=A0A2H3B437_9AGAR|nr:hypothetical protein ARMSODRAFT_1022084 [Armillaria solidipes]